MKCKCGKRLIAARHDKETLLTAMRCPDDNHNSTDEHDGLEVFDPDLVFMMNYRNIE